MQQNRFFGWGSAPDPAGSLQRSPDPLAVFKGPTSKGKEGKGKRGGKGKGGQNDLTHPVANSWLRHWATPMAWSSLRQHSFLISTVVSYAYVSKQ